MGDKATLTKARMELEEMYQGIPDESVNLTFQDFAELKVNNPNPSSGKTKKPSHMMMEPISELKSTTQPSPLTKLPSLDFTRALQASNHHNLHHHINDVIDDVVDPYSRGGHHDHHQGHATRGHRYGGGDDHHGHEGHVHNNNNNPPSCHSSGLRHGVDQSGMTSNYDHSHDVSGISMASMYQDRGERRRPGIPHSNICTICSTYIYIFRHRCLVCGRVYCRQCVMVGMGEMTEGRKCVECLGRRFSQRYIQRAGKVGCFSRYPDVVKQAELKWAEKGPRRSGNGAQGRGSMVSTISRSPVTPMTPMTPNRAHHAGSGPNSFVMSSSFSPYSPTNRHHLPF